MEAQGRLSSQDQYGRKESWILGWSPLQNAPDLGAAQTQVSAALPKAPHRMPPPAQRPAARTLPAWRSTSLSWSWAQLRGRRHRPQAEDAGPGPQGSRGAVGAPRAHTPPCSVPLDRRGGLCFCGRHLDPVTMGSRVCDREVQLRSPMLGPWGHVGRGGSAGVKSSLLLGCTPVMRAGNCSPQEGREQLKLSATMNNSF